MGLLSESARWLNEQMQTAAAPVDEDGNPALIVYQPLEGAAVDLTGLCWHGATLDTRREPPGGRGPAIELGDRDYLIPVDELDAQPVRGDRIVETAGQWVTTFEVITPAGTPPVQYSDPGRTRYRVHTKQVKRELAP
jgi:hypothetical protein